MGLKSNYSNGFRHTRGHKVRKTENFHKNELFFNSIVILYVREKIMDKKCNKYEAYYTFAGEEDFLAHLQECEDCRREYEKEQRLSRLIKESAGTYRRLEQRNNLKKSAVKIACLLFIFATVGIYNGFQVQQNGNYQQFLTATGTDTSVIAQEGLPVDDFGFFDYN